MKTDTKYFGEIEYEASDLITFTDPGLFGFEDEREFLLIPFEEDSALYSFQSVKTPGLAFVAVNPFTLDPEYTPILQPAELETLGVKESTDLCFYAFCAVKSPVANSTVNLRCPIAVNPDRRAAMQAILEGNEYGMRHLLSDVKRQEGEKC